MILYAAKWCGACQRATAHIESRSIAYAYRSVDDLATSEELAGKLRRAGTKDTVIPVTDIDGDLLIGWSAAQFDELYDRRR